jgi:hypothetical protein
VESVPRKLAGFTMPVALPAWVWACVGGGAVLLVAVVVVIFALRPRPIPEPVAAGTERQPTDKPHPVVEDPADDWRRFAPPEGRCSVLMPGTPKYERTVNNTPQGEVVLHNYTLRYGEQQFGVSYWDIPGVVPLGAQIDVLLNAARDGLAKNTPGTKLLKETPFSLGGYPGREWQLETANGNTFMTMRGVLAKQRMFLVLSETPRDRAKTKEIDKFLASLQITP